MNPEEARALGSGGRADSLSAADEQSRELTLDEAIEIVMLLQKSELDQAEALYRWIFETAPDHPEALRYAGVLAQQRGRSDEAVTLMQRSLALEPGRADWHSNLGIAYQAQAHVDDAIAAFTRAIELDPEHANAHSKLGVLLRATESRSRPSRLIARRYASLPITSTRIPISACC